MRKIQFLILVMLGFTSTVMYSYADECVEDDSYTKCALDISVKIVDGSVLRYADETRYTYELEIDSVRDIIDLYVEIRYNDNTELREAECNETYDVYSNETQTVIVCGYISNEKEMPDFIFFYMYPSFDDKTVFHGAILPLSKEIEESCQYHSVLTCFPYTAKTLVNIDADVAKATYDWNTGILTMEFVDGVTLFPDVSYYGLRDSDCGMQFARESKIFEGLGTNRIVLNLTEYQRDTLAYMTEPDIIIRDKYHIEYTSISLSEVGDRPEGNACIVSYGTNEYLLGIYTSGNEVEYLNAMHSAFTSWSSLNSQLKFVYVEKDPTINVKFEGDIEDALGYACLWCLGLDAEMVISSYAYDCKDRKKYYTPRSIQDTIAHELGHLMGLEHHPREGHLMYGSEPETPYNDLGYDIPQAILPNEEFVGHVGLLEEYDNLIDQLDSYVERYGTVEGSVVYFNTEAAVDEYNWMVNKYNQLLKEVDCLFNTSYH